MAETPGQEPRQEAQKAPQGGSGGQAGGKPQASAESATQSSASTVTLEPARWWQASYDPGIEGVEAIVRGGTEVPAEKVEEVEERAASAGVELRRKGE